MLEIGERAQVGQDVLVAALAGADGPGATRVVGAGLQAVVRPLAKAAANGVNGRQIEHVEAHLGDIGQALLHVLEGAVTARLVGGGAREHFIPRAEAGALAVHGDAQDALVGGAGAAVGVAGHHGFEGGIERGCHAAVALGHGLGLIEQPLAIGAADAPGGAPDQLRPFEQVATDILVGLDLLGEPLAP
jgi:hypothetical protein